MRILVTGASGLLGRATAVRLRDAGHDVRVLQRRASGIEGVAELRGDVRDEALLARAVAGRDAVVHLAAKVSLSGSEEEFHAVNVAATRALLAAAARAGPTRFVQVSSPSVAHAGQPLVGAGAAPAAPASARGAYARSKAAAELAALHADGPDLAVVAVRPHLVWGPGDTQLVGQVVERARAGRLVLVGAGTALVDTTYVDDAAAALVAALDRAEDVHGEAFVVTAGQPRPVAELLSGIAAAANIAPRLRRVPRRLATSIGVAVEAVWDRSGRDDEPPMTRFLAEQLSTAHWFDQRRTTTALRWSPRVGIDEGLARLAEWFAGR